MNRTHLWLWRSAAALLAMAALLCGLVAWLNVRGESTPGHAAPAPQDLQRTIARGAYLARAGNCMACHTTEGGARYAGGRGVDTPFGTVYAPNITADPATGIGAWTADDFWRAMHHGRSRDGRLLYPAFPYTNFTYVTREDADALYFYLRTQPTVAQANLPHALRFPYSTQAALAVWRALYFTPADFQPDAGRDADWNRGKYLVQGLGHCAACHSTRNTLGGLSASAEFAGGLMPDGGWYAPSLASPHEAGVQGWPREQVVKLLKDGVSAQASVSGPMAEVVYASTQHLSAQDLQAMAGYLATLPTHDDTARPANKPANAAADAVARGDKLYAQHCASCHGSSGQGAPGIYPALAGNRAVTLATPNNLLQLITQGGFMPATAGNPRPFGMPPYGQVLSNDEIAAVATYIRQSWGNAAAPVSALEVLRAR